MDNVKTKIGNWMWRKAWKLLSFSVVVSFRHVNKEDGTTHTSFPHYFPSRDYFVIDWKKRTVELQTKSK